MIQGLNFNKKKKKKFILLGLTHSLKFDVTNPISGGNMNMGVGYNAIHIPHKNTHTHNPMLTFSLVTLKTQLIYITN